MNQPAKHREILTLTRKMFPRFFNFITVKDKEEFSWDTKGAVEKAVSRGQVRTQQACTHGVPLAGSRNLQCGFSP